MISTNPQHANRLFKQKKGNLINLNMMKRKTLEIPTWSANFNLILIKEKYTVSGRNRGGKINKNNDDFSCRT